MAATILLADDDQSIRTVLSQALAREGYDVRASGTASGLWRWIEQGEGDLVITDVVMPDENGLDLIPRIRKLRPDLRIIVMSAQSTLLTAVRASESGAFDYLPKPFDLRALLSSVGRALAEPEAEGEDLEAAQQPEEALPLVGRSPAMQEIYRTIARLVPTDLTVMITGESGTGKELVARALHDLGRRRGAPFVAVNMAAIPRELIESELFGHEKGAFTGAGQRTYGRFAQAEGGTLFLDEIGDMPLEAQTRLLRVLQEGEYTTVGGRNPQQVDVRIVAATHRDLMQQVRNGLFREDLFYRINVVPIRLPSLRERREDIPELVRHFLRLAQEEGLPAKSIDEAAMSYLATQRWPGNVRELENMVRRMSVLCSEDHIGLDAVKAELGQRPRLAGGGDLSGESLSVLVRRKLEEYFAAHKQGLPARGLYQRILREVERPMIELTLSATKGNQVRAAQVLGLNRNTLRKKITELEIEVERGRR